MPRSYTCKYCLHPEVSNLGHLAGSSAAQQAVPGGPAESSENHCQNSSLDLFFKSYVKGLFLGVGPFVGGREPWEGAGWEVPRARSLRPVDEVIFFQVVANLSYVLSQLEEVLHGPGSGRTHIRPYRFGDP